MYSLSKKVNAGSVKNSENCCKASLKSCSVSPAIGFFHFMPEGMSLLSSSVFPLSSPLSHAARNEVKSGFQLESYCDEGHDDDDDEDSGVVETMSMSEKEDADAQEEEDERGGEDEEEGEEEGFTRWFNAYLSQKLVVPCCSTLLQ